MSRFTIRPLEASTWASFEALAEAHDGVWGGCWCMAFHLEQGFKGRTAAQNQAEKAERVRSGRAHAALVFEGDDAVGWCQFGPTGELPNIRSKKAYEERLGKLPDWRITCFFIDRERRGEGIATVALRDALREIARLGGGTVEGYPEDVTGRKVSRSFLCSGTLGMFEKAGFTRDRKIAMHRWVVTRRIRPSANALGPGSRARRSARAPRSSGEATGPRTPPSEPQGAEPTVKRTT